LLGREIAQCEERIRERNNEKRYLVEIERRKVLVRDRKVENGVRQKALVELTRVIDFVGKEVAALKKELGSLTDKRAFFGK
jgi:C-terminal processing protease CtpA/Prc